MAEKNIYIKLMEDLLGKIDPNDYVKDYKQQFDKSLSIFNKGIDETDRKHRFFAGPRDDYKDLILEPCPICYAGTLKEKFKVVFLGINPFFDDENKLKDKNIRKFECDNTKWQRLASFNCPKDEDEMSKSIFKHIVENALHGNKYHGDVFRLYLALTHEGKVFDNWSQVQEEAIRFAEKKYTNVKKGDVKKYIKEFVMEEYLKTPILFAEMIPYKSEKSTNIKMEYLLEYDEYKNYLIHLMEFINEHSSPDAILVFLGYQSNVKKFLLSTKGINKIIPSSFDSWDNYEKKFEAEKQKISIYFIKNNERRIILMPFLNSEAFGRIPLASNGLIEKIRKGEIFTSI